MNKNYGWRAEWAKLNANQSIERYRGNCYRQINQPDSPHNGEMTEKLNDCGDKTYAATNQGLADAWVDANAGKYYTTGWYPGADQFCGSVTSDEDCNYFGHFGDCWKTKYKLQKSGVGCINNSNVNSEAGGTHEGFPSTCNLYNKVDHCDDYAGGWAMQSGDAGKAQAQESCNGMYGDPLIGYKHRCNKEVTRVEHCPDPYPSPCVYQWACDNGDRC